ncbi:hypothetical protein X777_12145 [Ooceraea biroi]|uniref:Uncharacterized protein n=1 Tax=Ooceraea biroi TaxID=2015173 RepID=A0A026W0L6_OOCBI|nr:hypothetical protein X777_12145 [Ooceraea biroi]
MKLFLLGHTDRASTATGSLGVLTTYTKTPIVTQTPVSTDLLHPLQVFTQFRVQISTPLSSSLVQVDISLLQDDIGVTPTNTFDRSHGKHDFSITIDIRAHDTKNVLKLLRNHERLQQQQMYG